MNRKDTLADVLEIGALYSADPVGYHLGVLAMALESLPPPTLGDLRAIANGQWRQFLSACRAEGFADEWAAYKSEERTPWPPSLKAAHNLAMLDLHAFYGMRDGPNGVLGGRGENAGPT